MTSTEIYALADEAANEAVRYIQERIGIPTGDFAGLYFSGDKWDGITQILSDYIAAEVNQ
tara:strand:+ start:1093 stop:1272 length:180 start_codon:yes stop_codon:yes gene_type:complete